MPARMWPSSTWQASPCIPRTIFLRFLPYLSRNKATLSDTHATPTTKHQPPSDEARSGRERNESRASDPHSSALSLANRYDAAAQPHDSTTNYQVRKVDVCKLSRPPRPRHRHRVAARKLLGTVNRVLSATCPVLRCYPPARRKHTIDR